VINKFGNVDFLIKVFFKFTHNRTINITTLQTILELSILQYYKQYYV